MRQLHLTKEIEKRHLEYFMKNIEEKFRIIPKCRDAEKNEQIIKLFEIFEENSKELAIGRPGELRRLSKKIEEFVGDLWDYEVSEEKTSNKKELKTYIDEIFGYKTFSKVPGYASVEAITQENYSNIHNGELMKWSAYSFVFESGIRVCPYCNRQYITPIYSRKDPDKPGHLLRADLDHFYPKGKYPYLSMSLYNLVPSCKFCNSSLKGIKEFDFNDVNPYEDSFGDHFDFKYLISEKKIKVDMINEPRIKNYLSFFQIEELNSYHTNVAEDMMEKAKMYPDDYVENLYQNYKSNVGNKQQLRELIFGITEDKAQINDEVLAKLKQDIARQLDIIE